jgi:hypothetical protein
LPDIIEAEIDAVAVAVRFPVTLNVPPMVPFPEVWILDPEIVLVALITDGAIVCAATPATTCAELDTVLAGSWAELLNMPDGILVKLAYGNVPVCDPLNDPENGSVKVLNCVDEETVPPGSNGATCADAETTPLNLLVILL